MSTDERKQAEAVMILGIIIALWLSHYVTNWWPTAPGNYDLRLILRFWNKPIWINWPSAIALFFVGGAIGKNIWRQMAAQELRAKQREAKWLSGQTDDRKKDRKSHRPIL